MKSNLKTYISQCEEKKAELLSLTRQIETADKELDKKNAELSQTTVLIENLKDSVKLIYKLLAPKRKTKQKNFIPQELQNELEVNKKEFDNVFTSNEPIA